MGRFQLVLPLLLMSAPLFFAMPSPAAARSDSAAVALAGHGPGYRSHDGSANRSVEGELTPEMMRQAIRKHLEEEWGQRVKEVQVAVLDPADSMGVPPGKVDVRVDPAPSGGGVGRRMFQVAVAVNGQPWKTVEVMADVTAMIDAVVVNRFFKPEELVEAPDVKTARVRISQLPHPFVTDREEVIGKSAARPLPPDTPLRAAFLKAPIVIKKGDRVTIEAKRGGLSIQTYGVTKSSGYIGQTVMVANLDSGREFRAKIVAPGLVQVEF